MHDIVVIGGGPGGYAAAIRAAQLGGAVALVEAGDIGGTCVNRGCIPGKIWRHSACLLDQIRTGETFGIRAMAPQPDFAAIVARKNGVAADIRAGMEGLLSNNGIEVVRGRAILKNPGEVDVEGKMLAAKKVILATGSRLDIPDIPGLDEVLLTSDQFMELNHIPDKVLVWGGQAMAVEIASVLNTFGAEVVIATPEARILNAEDQETSQRVAQALKEQGIKLMVKTTLMSIRKTGNIHEAVLAGKEETTLPVEKVLVAKRRPNTEKMGLSRAGLKFNPDGGVAVNKHLKTSLDGVYAVGDITGGWMLSHAASAMAVSAAENALGRVGEFPFYLIPRGIWTTPQVGAVGLSEDEAEDRGYEVETGDFPFAINGVAMALDEMAGAVKIVSDARYGEILGVHIVGGHATEMVGEAVLAMQLECTVAELARSMRVHPTFSESIVDAAREALNWALYLPKVIKS